MTPVAPVFDRLGSLADPTRGRILVLLEGTELSVGELCVILQLPQSTVSRHLKLLSDEGWVAARDAGPARFYALVPSRLDPFAKRLWNIVREPVADGPAARQDARRRDSVLAARRSRVQTYFRGAAPTWDRVRESLIGQRTDLLALLDLFGAEWTVGDLGCGTGILAEAVAPTVRRVIAVDESANMLSAARRRLTRFENVEIRTGRLEKLPIEDSALDVALLFMVAHFVTEPARVLAEVRRALAPRGRLLIADLTEHAHQASSLTNGHLWQGFTEEQMRAWVTDAGLSVARYRVLRADPAARGPTLFSLLAVNDQRPGRGTNRRHS